ncbi:MAG: FixH family protein [Hyphomicrobiaceae bacterium]
MSQALTPRRIEGRHVLAIFLAFFGVMLAANGAFVYFALSTFGGVETEDAYRKGLDYNATLGEANAQASLGWQPALALDAASGTLTLKVADKTGKPVTGLKITGVLMRPVTNVGDRKLDGFVEQAGGIYVERLDALVPGTWIADLAMQWETGIPFKMRERLWQPPKS